jgi:hypothetical protein
MSDVWTADAVLAVHQTYHSEYYRVHLCHTGGRPPDSRFHVGPVHNLSTSEFLLPPSACLQ